MAPERQKPSQWLCLTKLPREMCSQPIVHKALSWGIIRKSACILAAITIRKSHPLEDSCQEAIRPLYTTFDIFSRCVPIGTLRPRCVISDASVFSLSWRRLCCAAPATHQDQGALTSRVLARRLPLARSVPQKTLGSLPCPIGYISQMSWLPRGSNFSRAHGRGVARLHQSVAGHLSRVETGANQKAWLITNFSPSLQPQPNGWPDLSQTLSSPQRARGLA